MTLTPDPSRGTAETLWVQINYQVSDSGCVVTVRDTGVASLAPRTRIRETDSTHGGRRTL
eukprot:COSAG06_NODE_16523_length_996_cov_3.587514_1_plen_59_part_10